MGCDIHGFLEVETPNGWFVYKELPIDRRYFVFRLMGHDGRGPEDLEPVAPLRGLPANVSEIARLEHQRMDADAHSASWLSLDEWLEVLRRATEWQDIGAKDGLHDLKMVCNYRVTVDDWEYTGVRLVFWFDN